MSSLSPAHFDSSPLLCYPSVSLLFLLQSIHSICTLSAALPGMDRALSLSPSFTSPRSGRARSALLPPLSFYLPHTVPCSRFWTVPIPTLVLSSHVGKRTTIGRNTVCRSRGSCCTYVRLKIARLQVQCSLENADKFGALAQYIVQDLIN